VNDATGVSQRLAGVRASIRAACERAGRGPAEVVLLAVSKQQPSDTVRAAHAAGQREFGENRVQELTAKAADLADLPDLQWHMIGSLQTNKVRELLRVPGLRMLHSLDRSRLADELQRELSRLARQLEVLLEVHATDEASKHGCRPEDAPALVAHVQANCPALALRGLMGMGPLDGDPAPAFARVADLREELRQRFGLPLPVLSLGMSGDLEAAIGAGSTMVRIGTAVFGPRG
jgi:pyridoxal phosphate enzyme (YggS family)